MTLKKNVLLSLKKKSVNYVKNVIMEIVINVRRMLSLGITLIVNVKMGMFSIKF